jgi:exonuclease VII large subunit
MARLGDLAVGAVAAQRGEVAYLARRLAHNGVDVDKERQRLDEISHTVILLARGGVAAGRSLFNQQMAALTSLDPTSTLARGYAIVTNRRSGRVVRRTEQAPGGDPLDVQVSDGTFAAVAEGVALGRARRRRPVPAEQMLLLPPARG